jgi:serralysin
VTLFSTTQVVAAEGTPYAFGFKELLLWSSGSTSVLWAATGSGGGLASFDILTDGTLILVESIDYPSFIRAGVDPDLSGAMGDGALLVGGLMGFGFEMAATGTSGSYVDFGDASLSYISPIWIAIGGAHFVLAGDPDGGTFLYDWSSAAPEPVAMWSTDTFGDAAALPGGYVAMAFPSADRLDIWLPGADGSADVVATVGATDGLGWSVPGLLDQVSLGGYSYLIVGGQGSSSLTVLNFGPDGALTVADHVIDSPDTRFATVQAIDAISLGGEAYVAAGGADDGITILHLLDNGRLVPLQTIVDDNVTGLTNVTGLAFFAAGGVLSLAASSEGDAGLTVFSAEVSQMPRAVIGTDAVKPCWGPRGPTPFSTAAGPMC